MVLPSWGKQAISPSSTVAPTRQEDFPAMVAVAISLTDAARKVLHVHAEVPQRLKARSAGTAALATPSLATKNPAGVPPVSSWTENGPVPGMSP
jgi:hypothetical protein